MRRPTTLPAALLATLLLAACSDPALTDVDPTLARAGYDQPGVHRQYGTPVQVGDGRARSYVVIDQKSGGRALELGVAFDERAMDNLPAPGTGHSHPGHAEMHEFLLPLPARNPTAFKLVELDWNPVGHSAPYDTPHFDFHFYTITPAERDAIDPSNPNYATEADNPPSAAAVPPSYANPAALLGVPGAAVAVPRMGMHWIDLRSPELQGLLGNPAGYQPFTTTFNYGAWDGQFIFLEPMITRAYIMAKRGATDPAVRDEVIPISTSPTFPAGAFRPDAYRIAWDAQAKEYRIALTYLGGE